MSKLVVVDLPDEIYRRAESLARLARREVGEGLADAITLSLSSLDGPGIEGSPMAGLSDREVIELTALQLPPAQDRRLSQLLQRQQAQGLTETERTELQALMQQYQQGLLRKAEALNEAVRRGLRGSSDAPPLGARRSTPCSSTTSSPSWSDASGSPSAGIRLEVTASRWPRGHGDACADVDEQVEQAMSVTTHAG